MFEVDIDESILLIYNVDVDDKVFNFVFVAYNVKSGLFGIG
jgi:hypothetical protein